MADLAPARLQTWTFEKVHAHENSADSERSSSDFFDAEDKLRFTRSIDEIDAALAEKSQPLFNKEYMSSEEALSPVMDEESELSDAGELDEETELDSPESVGMDLWEEIKVFALDIAITLSFQFVGPPKVVDLHYPYTTDPFHVAPLRIDSLPPRSERRTQVRTQDLPALSSRFSGSSLDAMSPTACAPLADSPDTLCSRFSGSSCADSPTTAVHSRELRDSSSTTGSTESTHQTSSIFSMANDNISPAWTPPQSDQGSSSPTPSFLQSDPFEAAVTRQKPTHSRLRSISSKFSKLSFSAKNGTFEEDKTQKREQRKSFMTPSTPVLLLEGNDSSNHRDFSARLAPSQQPTFIAPLQATPTRRVFPRMIARAANERAAPISIPPCPDDYDVVSPPELLRSQTLFSREPSHAQQNMRRRRSLLLFG